MKNRSCGNCAYLLVPSSRNPCQLCDDESEWLPCELEKLKAQRDELIDAFGDCGHGALYSGKPIHPDCKSCQLVAKIRNEVPK
jgi:hypothetical protein